MSLCIMSMAYGDYWDIWHKQWIENLEATDPKPDRVLLISDTKKDVPSWVENIAIGSPFPITST